MIITFHGTGAGTGRLGRKPSCIEVESVQTRLLLDAGSYPAGEPKQLDAIIISHTHPDHVCALPQILMDNHLWHKKLPDIFVPSRDRESTLRMLFMTNTELYYNGIGTIDDGFGFNIGNLHIMPILNSHSLKTMSDGAFRSFSFYIGNEKERIYYSGDVGSFEEIVSHLACAFRYQTAIIEGSHYDLNLLYQMPKILGNKMPERILLTHVWNPKRVPERPYVEIPDFVTTVNDGDIINTKE